MPEWIPYVITAFATFISSSGFWAYAQSRSGSNSAQLELLIGIGYFTIQEECIRHLQAGYISREQYNDIYHHLYEPYQALGGNGTAQKMMVDLGNLPMVPRQTKGKDPE